MNALLSKGLYGGAFVLLSLSLPLFTACSSDDSAESTNGESGGIATGATTAGHFFLDAAADDGTEYILQNTFFLDAAADDGTEYILQNTSVTDGDLNISSNIKELPTSPYTWVFKDSYAVGVSYQQQYPGLGYCVKLTDETKPFEQIGQFQVNDRFTTYRSTTASRPMASSTICLSPRYPVRPGATAPTSPSSTSGRSTTVA